MAVEERCVGTLLEIGMTWAEEVEVRCGREDGNSGVLVEYGRMKRDGGVFVGGKRAEKGIEREIVRAVGSMPAGSSEYFFGIL